MALAWALFFPAGIIFARFSPDFKTVGFRAHWMLQSVGALLAFAGFFTAVYFTDDLGRGESGVSQSVEGFRHPWHPCWGQAMGYSYSLALSWFGRGSSKHAEGFGSVIPAQGVHGSSHMKREVSG